MNKKKVGIFGGTFNPPHIGHVASAKCFLQQMELDELLIVPTFIPPHKAYESSVSCDERLTMCKLAFVDIPNVVVSDMEIKRGGASYTYLTLKELSNENTELYFLCGTDMILSMDEWKNPDVIFALAKICYIRRENDNSNDLLIKQKCEEYRKKYQAELFQINASAIEISSSEIRSEDADMESFLPKAVYDYIKEMELYK